MGWTKKERQSPEEDLRSGRPLALEHYPVDSIGKKRETCNSGDKSRPGMIKEGQQALLETAEDIVDVVACGNNSCRY